MRTLLVDDDEWIRNSMSLLFESEGCYLMAVETAEEGMEALIKQSYDVIISDYRLPGMDGLEFFKKIKTSYPHVIKILITAYGSCDVFSRAKTLGVNDLIEKPFTLEVIEKSLSRLIDKRECKNISGTKCQPTSQWIDTEPGIL
jgi:DNA-binding NtrC family response regulator